MELENQLRFGADVYGIPRAEFIQLQTPARYLGNEFGAVHKEWMSASIRFCLTYPEIYEVGASNLGHIVLYTVLNEAEGLLCDRTYMPGDDMQALLAKHSKSLFAVESKRPLRDFDTLGFSLAYELGATNVLQMLKMSNIPISWKERLGDSARPTPWNVDEDPSATPLVFAGGPTATSNPEPFADFFDYFALGDGEDLLPEIGRCLQTCKADGLDRVETLFRLCTTVRGVYVPMFYDSPPGWGGAVYPVREGVPARVLRRVAPPDPFRQIGLVPFVNTVHDRLTIEIRRGCTRGCRFCQPGMLTRPARDVSPEDVVNAVEEGMRKTGYNEFSLLSLSCSDYLALPAVGLEIKNRLKDENVSLSLPSQRVDRFNEDIANIVNNGARKSGLTFAPEAGTQRLRDIINKGLTNEELLRGVKTAFDQGWWQVKLYFMVGLPGETDADVLGIVETIKWLQQECTRGHKHIAINTTISNFTPKPHTPFQWHSVSREEFERKHRLLEDAFKSQRLQQVKYNITPLGISAMEDFIGRGDRAICSVIRRAWELGATNDGWWYNMDEAFAKYNLAIEEAGLTWKYRQIDQGEWDVMEKLGDENYRKQGGGGKGRIDRGQFADDRLNAPLPWDHINTGISKEWLKTDLQRALEAATVPDCSHSGLCSECGVCGDDFGDNVVAQVPPTPTFSGHPTLNTTRAQRILIRMGKQGSMVYIGHLDLLHVFERALRRAAMPVTMDSSPYHARPRIKTALPLPLGASSMSEFVEVELTRKMDVQEFRKQFQAQLPDGLPIVSVEELPVTKLNGAIAESTTALLDQVDWFVAAEMTAPCPTDSATPTNTDIEPAEESEEEPDLVPDLELTGEEAAAEMEEVIRGTLAMSECSVVKLSKRKKRKKTIDLRPRLHKLSIVRAPEKTAIAGMYDETSKTTFVIRAVGNAMTHDMLTPDTLKTLLERGCGNKYTFQLRAIHREGLTLKEPPAIPINSGYLRSFVHAEAYRALNRRFGRRECDGALIE